MTASILPLPTARTTATSAATDMRAMIQSGYGGLDVFRAGTIARPAPGPGEVLVKVEAAALDRGTWHLMTGRPYLMRIMGFGFRAPKEPVPGLDLSGTVVEVGPGVTRFRVGDEVFGVGRGSFAEFARAREDKLAPKPRNMSFQQAAALAVSGGTALQAVDAAKIQAGDRVLIIGASGGVGTFAVQIAKARGAHVTGVARGSKLGMLRAAGCDEVIDYTAQDATDGSQKYDVILDAGGGTPTRRLRRALAPAGRVVFIGNEHGGDWTAGLGRPLLAMIRGMFSRQRFIMLASKEHHSHYERLGEMVNAGQVTPVIDRVMPVRELATAMSELEAGRVAGKIVLKP